VSEKDPLNLSDEEFDTVMTEIDAAIIQRGKKIPGRELAGWVEFCTRYRVSISNEHPTALRIFNWFTRMYGDRLNVDWDFGRSVALVKGEVCKIQGIRFYGPMVVACSTAVLGDVLQMAIQGGVIQITNLLEGVVQGLTPELARRLSPEECHGILTAYGQMFLTFSRLESALGAKHGTSDAPYITKAMHDLVGSTESLLTAPPNYGQSKWASLQAAEKTVKSCILEKGASHKKSHSLADLCADAVVVGVPLVDPALIARIECSPAVRYDSTLVGKDEAIAAHYAALTVCGELAPVVKRTKAESAVSKRELKSGDSVLTCLVLEYTPHAAGMFGP
jgi:hypothetical protein